MFLKLFSADTARIALDGIALGGIALDGIALGGIALDGIALGGIALGGIALGGIPFKFGTITTSIDNSCLINILTHGQHIS